MKKIILIASIIFTLTILAIVICFDYKLPCSGLGCTGDYYFQDTATFIAPKSKLKIIVTCSGYIPDKMDLGDGKGFVKLFSTDSQSDTMFLITSPENIDTIIYRGKTIPFSCSQMEKNNFYDYLISVDYKQLDKNEILELRDAMTLINYGHKAGFCKGQTKYIEVVEHKK